VVDSGRNLRPLVSQCLCERMSPLAYGSGRTNFYYYDHARRLVKETHTCTGVVQESSSFVYDGLDIVAKVDNLTGEMIYFTRGLGVAPGVGDVLAESHIASNGSLKCTYVYVQNHRGDTIALVSNSTVVARYEYGAWGNVVSHTGSDAWLTFSGKHYDTDAGLYYYGFRWYDPQAKRWTQPDPSGLAEGLDLYQFCGNDPVNQVDEDGLAHNDFNKTFPTWCISAVPNGKYLVESTWYAAPDYARVAAYNTLQQVQYNGGVIPPGTKIQLDSERLISDKRFSFPFDSPTRDTLLASLSKDLFYGDWEYSAHFPGSPSLNETFSIPESDNCPELSPWRYLYGNCPLDHPDQYIYDVDLNNPNEESPAGAAVMLLSSPLCVLADKILNVGVRENLIYHTIDALVQRYWHPQSYKVRAELINQGRYNVKDVPWTGK